MPTDHGFPVDLDRQCEAKSKGSGYTRLCKNYPIKDNAFCGEHGGLPEHTEAEKAQMKMLFVPFQGDYLIMALEPLQRWAHRTPEDLVSALKANRKAKRAKQILDDIMPMLTELRKQL